MIKELGQKTAKWYKTIAILLLNTLLIFIILNLVLAAVLYFRPAIEGSLSYGGKLDKVYPEMSAKDRTAMLREIWNRPQIYEPYVQFKEEPFSGKYLNIRSASFFTYRVIKDQCSWPMNKSNFNIFVFGGSTTFGYGQPDNQTIPSYMQQYLRDAGGANICVYNLAQGSYFSTQERVLFERMLASGVQPNLAIFIDGLNEYTIFNNEPYYTTTLRSFMNDNNPFSILRRLPIIRAITYIHVEEKMNKRSDAELQQIANTYFNNVDQINVVAKSKNIPVLFVIQPIPLYNYNLSNHFLYNGKDSFFARHYAAGQGYPILKATPSSANNVLWLADIQSGASINFYVDRVHYTAYFNDLIAKSIVIALLRV